MRVGVGRSVDRFLVYALSALLLIAAVATFASASMHHPAKSAGAAMTSKMAAVPVRESGHSNVGLF
ncbi:MAG: hypothetical protein WDN76_04900 [Alphaproteobacteria bacterium]